MTTTVSSLNPFPGRAIASGQNHVPWCDCEECHDATDDDEVCPQCGAEMERKFGIVDDSDEPGGYDECSDPECGWWR